MLIVLFGPDRSGKSTLAKALANKLSKEGYKIEVRWMRGTHTLASLLATFLSRFESFKGSGNPYYQISIPKNFLRTWQLIEFISVLPVLIFRFILPSSLKIVVAERYTPDFIAWVSITTNDDYINRFEAKFLLALVHKAAIKVYVTAEIDKLQERGEKDTNFLKKQITVYEKIAKSINAFKLDTTDRNVDESSNAIINLLRAKSSSQLK